MWRVGWRPTGCSLITPSRKCSGARQHVVSTRSQVVPFVSEAQPCNLYPLYAIIRIMLDAEVTISKHVSAVVKASFAALRRIRSVRRSVPRRALLTLIQALVVSKIDYCNSVLAGVSADTLLRWLQSVLNAAARLVFSARRSEHITPLLRELHWLTVLERIKFRLCVLAFRCLQASWYSATVPRRDLAFDNQP